MKQVGERILWKSRIEDTLKDFAPHFGTDCSWNVSVKKNAAAFRETKIFWMERSGALRQRVSSILAAMPHCKDHTGRRHFILVTKTMALNLAECRDEELKSACV